MATALTVQDVVGPYPSLPVAADGLDVTFAAGDVAGNTFAATGRELLLVQNTGAGAATVTVTSQADALKRTGDISAYSVGAGEFAAFWFGKIAGWRDGDGLVTVTPSSTDLAFAVLRLPR